MRDWLKRYLEKINIGVIRLINILILLSIAIYFKEGVKEKYSKTWICIICIITILVLL
jgi:hypothetical protein